MTQDKKKLTRIDWFRHIDEQEKSGISQAEFCKQKQMSACQFSYYRGLHVKSRNENKTEPSFSSIAIKQKLSADIEAISILKPGSGLTC